MVTGANDYFRFGEEAICNEEKDKQTMAAATFDLASTTSNSTGGRRRRISLAQKFCIPKVRPTKGSTLYGREECLFTSFHVTVFY